MQRQLKDDKILETAEKLRGRVSERFPDSGLAGVATELVQVTREAVDRAAAIRRPNYWIRGGLVLVAAVALSGIAWEFATSPDLKTAAKDSLALIDAYKGLGVYLVAAAAFLVSVEIRWKRRKALRAVHELRAVAHLIDMHQLNKAPERIGTKDGPRMEYGRLMTKEEVNYYLHYCTELLAIVSKIGQLYVQDFPDTAATTVVDNCESLATGLSSKIWQKLMILDRIDADGPAESPREAAGPASR